VLTVSYAISGLGSILLAAFVLYRGHRQALSRAFAYFVTCGGLWVMSVSAVTSGRLSGIPFIVAGHLAFVFGALGVSGFCAFALMFPYPYIPKGTHVRMSLVYGIGAMLAVLGATPLVFAGPDPATIGSDNVRPIYGMLFPLWALGIVGCTLWAIYTLATKYRQVETARERLQVSYLIVGYLIGISISVFLVVIAPILGMTRLSPLAPMTLLIGFVSTAVAITKHRLFNLGVVFRQALVGAGLTLVIALVIGIVLSGVQLMLGSDPFYHTIALAMAAVIAGLLIPTIRQAFEQVVDRYVFGGPPVDSQAIRALSHELTKWLSVRPMAELLVDGIGRAMRLSNVTLYLLDQDEGVWHATASWPDDFPAWPELAGDTPIAVLGSSATDPLEADRLRYDENDLKQACFKAMAAINADIVMPLRAEDRLLGLLSVGEKRNGDTLSEAELSLLVALVHQASTALSNALLHEEIVRMKVHNDNILRDMASGVIAVDRRGIIRTCNVRAATMLGGAPKAFLGQDANILPAALSAPLTQARLYGQTVRHVRTTLPGERGKTCTIGLHTSVLNNEKGETIGALALFEDHTERLRLEEGMQRADRLASLGTLATGLAHEIKNPLVSIRTLAQLLPSRFDDPEFRESFAQLAGEEVERINDLLEQLLAFARPTPASLEYIPIGLIIDDVLRLMGPELSSNGIEVQRVGTTESAWILADVGQMRQVFLNLVLNAMQAMVQADSTRRELAVEIAINKQSVSSLRPPTPWALESMDMEDVPNVDSQVTVHVRDSGPGVPDGLCDQIFDPFFTTKPKGTGLGLSVVARIIREHGGTIRAENRPEGGAEFIIDFPARVAETATVR